MPPPRRDFEKTRQQLAEWLHGKLPRATELVVSDRSRARPRPASRTTRCSSTSTSVEDGRREHRALVARIEPTGFGVFPTYDVDDCSTAIMAALRGDRRAGAADVLVGARPALLGAPFYVMERVDGRIPTDNPPYHAGGWMTESAPAERGAIWSSGLDTLAAIHRCDAAKRSASTSSTRRRRAQTPSRGSSSTGSATASGSRTGARSRRSTRLAVARRASPAAVASAATSAGATRASAT